MIRLSRLLMLSVLSLLLSVSAPTVSAQQTNDFTVGLDMLALERFEDAHNVFQQLMPLGSADSAYMIGLMLIEERGTEYNPVKSLGYLLAARAWGNEQAQDIIMQIEPHLSAAELAEANQLLLTLSRSVQVAFDVRDLQIDAEPPEALDRVQPVLTAEIARANNHGWIEMIVAINTQGRVIAMQPLNLAHRDFLRAVTRALRGWRYAEEDSVSITTVLIDYSIGEAGEGVAVDVLNAYNEALPQASVGVTEQQVYLAGLTQALTRYGSEQVSELPEAHYWYERAARNGNLQAQRFLALRYVHPEWAEHLIAKGDLDVMAWHGMRLFTQSENVEQKQRGRELLESAAESGSRIAEDLLEQI